MKKNILINGYYSARAFGCLTQDDIVNFNKIYIHSSTIDNSMQLTRLISESTKIEKVGKWAAPMNIVDKHFNLSKSEMDYIYTKMATLITPLYRYKISDNQFYLQIIIIDTFTWWLNFFKKNKVDYILSDKPDYLDSIILVAAKFLNIPIFNLFVLASQSNGQFIFYIYDENKKITLNLGDGSVDIEKYIFPLKKNKHKQYIFKNMYLQEFAHNLSRFKIINASRIIGTLIDYLEMKKTAQNVYKKLSEADLEQKFIYYPLHFDPEMTTMPHEEAMSNQLINIKILSSSLPDGWTVIIKDHPAQHNLSFMTLTVEKYLKNIKHYRDGKFYRYISSLPNVKIIDHNYDSKKLITKARAIASICGTVFLEASYYNKPILVFGQKVPHAELSNAFTIKDIETCKIALAKLNTTPKIKSDIEEFMKKNTISANSLRLNENDCNNLKKLLINFFQQIKV